MIAIPTLLTEFSPLLLNNIFTCDDIILNIYSRMQISSLLIIEERYET